MTAICLTLLAEILNAKMNMVPEVMTNDFGTAACPYALRNKF